MGVIDHSRKKTDDLNSNLLCNCSEFCPFIEVISTCITEVFNVLTPGEMLGLQLRRVIKN